MHRRALAPGLQEHSPCCAQCPGNPHHSPRAPGPLPAAQLCVHPSQGSPMKEKAGTAAVTLCTACAVAPRTSPLCPSSALTRDWGGWGVRAAGHQQRSRLGRGQEMVQDCLLAAWEMTAMSLEMDIRHMMVSMHTQLAQQHPREQREHEEGMAEGQTHLRDEDPQLRGFSSSDVEAQL